MVPRRAGQYGRARVNRMLVAFASCGLAVLIVLVLFRHTLIVAIPLFGFEVFLITRKDVRETMNRHKGAKGEEQVGALLSQLDGEGYRLLHGERFAGGDVDHVVVGPTGVFAIETKAWRGDVWLAKGGELMCGRRNEERTIKQVTHEAMEIGSRLAKQGMKTWVEAIVVLTEIALPKGPIDLPRVTVLEIGDLLDFIRARKGNQSPERVIKGANAILRNGAPVVVRAVSYD